MGLFSALANSFSACRLTSVQAIGLIRCACAANDIHKHVISWYKLIRLLAAEYKLAYCPAHFRCTRPIKQIIAMGWPHISGTVSSFSLWYSYPNTHLTKISQLHKYIEFSQIRSHLWLDLGKPSMNTQGAQCALLVPQVENYQSPVLP